MADKINPLVKHQKVFMIDAHGHELNPDERRRIYDDKSYDLHMHKKTNSIAINGKKECTADIRIPINNPQREMLIQVDGSEKDEIPKRIKKEIRDALSDTKTCEKFVKSVIEIMSSYPSSVKDNKGKTEETLRRFSQAFGARQISIKDEWFTHINQEPKGVSMLSLIFKDKERYNFLACDDFLLAEQAEQTSKTIIGLYGAANRGKSATIKQVFDILIERHPEHAIIIDNGKLSGDVKAILFIHGAKVGIESQGDPNSRQMRTIEEFANMGCDVILTASRSWGMTTDSITKHKEYYNIVWRHKRYDFSEKDIQYVTNFVEASQLAKLIEELSIAAFEKL